MADSLPPPPPPPPGGYAGGALPPNPTAAYAGWGARVGAYLIDYVPFVILYALGFVLGRPETKTVTTENGFEITATSGFGALFYVFLLLAIVYWLWNRVFKMGSTGQSIGMGVVNTKAIGERTGAPIGAGMNFLRQILLGVDFAICYVGVLWPLWDQKKQCLLSDKVASTIVVKV